MHTCKHCNAENKDTDVYCYRCGQLLATIVGTVEPSTRILQNQTEKLAFPSRMWGTARLDVEAMITLRIKGHNEPLQVVLEDELIVGRTVGDVTVDVDLSPYEAAQHGVSRRHAMLKRQNDTVTVTDLGSANHTFINGQRIVSNESRILRDGDELRLGRLVMNINFGDGA